jgi:hypothetical protein
MSTTPEATTFGWTAEGRIVMGALDFCASTDE